MLQPLVVVAQRHGRTLKRTQVHLVATYPSAQALSLRQFLGLILQQLIWRYLGYKDKLIQRHIFASM